jgi:transposase
LFEEFYAKAVSLNIAPKSVLGIAVHYVFSQWKYLDRYLMDGRLEISNHRAERSIKPFVFDRKNFLFSNTSRGAKASAVMFSLIETAKEDGLNSFKYLVHIFENAPNRNIRNNPGALQQLMPAFMPDYVRAMKGSCHLIDAYVFVVLSCAFRGCLWFDLRAYC